MASSLTHQVDIQLPCANSTAKVPRPAFTTLPNLLPCFHVCAEMFSRPSMHRSQSSLVLPCIISQCSAHASMPESSRNSDARGRKPWPRKLNILVKRSQLKVTHPCDHHRGQHHQHKRNKAQKSDLKLAADAIPLTLPAQRAT